MKKFVLIALLCTLTATSYAQLRITEYGQAIIGVEPPPYYPEIDKRDHDSMCKIFGPNGDMGAGGRISFGDQMHRRVYNVVVGELGTEDCDKLWLHGKLGHYMTTGQDQTGVVCFYDVDQGNFFKFNCDVHTSGVFISSDSLLKEDIKPLKKSLLGLRNVKAVSYKLKPQINYSSLESTEAMTPKEKRQAEVLKKLKQDQKNEPARFGFIAQDIKEIYPELVHTDKSGLMSVDYIGMIPLLVDAINELRDTYDAEIAALNEKITNLEEGNTPKISSDGKISEDIVPSLKQNTPNPFSVSTKISYTLPYTVRRADLYIYDMQGNQIRKIEITDRGESSITIQGSELSAGMYIYALIADNSEIDSKRMILTQ